MTFYPCDIRRCFAETRNWFSELEGQSSMWRQRLWSLLHQSQTWWRGKELFCLLIRDDGSRSVGSWWILIKAVTTVRAASLCILVHTWNLTPCIPYSSFPLTLTPLTFASFYKYSGPMHIECLNCTGIWATDPRVKGGGLPKKFFALTLKISHS